MRPHRWVPLFALLSGASCANYHEQFDRADEHFRAARYEAALTNLDDLEHDLGRFERPERARYYYLRGMSQAHLGQRADARHWLALSRQEADGYNNALTADMRAQLDRTLAEVDWVVNPSNEDHPNRPPNDPAGSPNASVGSSPSRSTSSVSATPR